jgi:hypothetical protein
MLLVGALTAAFVIGLISVVIVLLEPLQSLTQ